MHSSTFHQETVSIPNEGEVFVAAAMLVTEGRIPGPSQFCTSKSKDFHEGPHCSLIKGGENHTCDSEHPLCQKFKSNSETIQKFYKKGALCIEVLFTCACKEINNNESDNLDNAFLLEQWQFILGAKRDTTTICFSTNQLVSAIRSQLYFSQLTAWLVTQDKKYCQIKLENLRYRLSTPDELLAPLKFSLTASKHDFPITDIGNGSTLSVSFLSSPRTSSIPTFNCVNCSLKVLNLDTSNTKMELKNGLLDDRMQTSCTLKGKHRCEDMEENDNLKGKTRTCSNKRICQLFKEDNTETCEKPILGHLNTTKSKSKPNFKVPEFCLGYVCKDEKLSPTFRQHIEEAKKDLERHNMWPHERCHNLNDLRTVEDKGQLLLDAIERSGKKNLNVSDIHCVQKQNRAKQSECDNFNCDMSESDILSNRRKNNFNIYVDSNCDTPLSVRQMNMRDVSNVPLENRISKRTGARKKITFEENTDDEFLSINHNKITTSIICEIPTPSDQAKFRRELGNATSMVFHSRTGLPLTSSPAPVRKGKTRFDFDSSLNSVSAIKSALYSNSFSTDDESESEGSVLSPCSPEIYAGLKKDTCLTIYRHRRGQSSSLLGSFEESVLNGRLEPVSTVQGFTADLGASGSFVPKHIHVPVTVFFYTLGDNDEVSVPYLGHINLSKKGYNVPKAGTVQITLFNPLGSVVKMFVIMYDLSDMPPNSQTFIRQRTLYVPTDCKDDNLQWSSKWLRFLIHLRFMSSKSGKIYLHSDIRMIIMIKSDMDTATAHDDIRYEFRSFTQMPSNPKFSPRK